MFDKIKAIMMEQLNIDENDMEEEFGIEIPQEELENIVTVGDAVEFIKENGIE